MSTTSPKQAEAWVGPDEAAKHLGVTRRWIARAIAEKPDFPHRKLGSDSRSRLRFKLSEIDAWLDKQPGASPQR